MEYRHRSGAAVSWRRPAERCECAVRHLPDSTAGQRVRTEFVGCPCVVRCCPLATQEEDESGPAFDRPQLSEPPGDPEMKETALLLKIWVPLGLSPAAEQKQNGTQDSPPGPPPGDGAVRSPSPGEQSSSSPGRPSQDRFPLPLPLFGAAWTGGTAGLRPAPRRRLGGGCCCDAGAEADADGRPRRRAG